MAGNKQDSKNSITLKGSAQLVSEFFCECLSVKCLSSVPEVCGGVYLVWQVATVTNHELEKYQWVSWKAEATKL